MKPKIKAAGVLPYSKDSNGNTWFLLGREKPNQSWGVDSGSWSEFGGSLNSGETPEVGAAREFFEETMGSVFGNRAWIENELKHGRYLLAMDSKTPSGKGYRSFLKYIPFVDYPSKFARYKTMSRKFPNLLRQLSPDCFDAQSGNMLQTCAEKTSIGWFSVKQMKDAIFNYKRARDQPARREGQSSYYEPDMIPHIRWGFAMDIDHLMNSDWANNGFQNDESYFPRSLPLDPGRGGGFDIIRTESSTLRPIMKSPRFLTSRAGGNPPVIFVKTEGYSFKKKKRKRKRPKAGSPPAKKQDSHTWTVVTTKRKRRKKRANTTRFSYRPKPPVF